MLKLVKFPVKLRTAWQFDAFCAAMCEWYPKLRVTYAMRRIRNYARSESFRYTVEPNCWDEINKYYGRYEALTWGEFKSIFLNKDLTG